MAKHKLIKTEEVIKLYTEKGLNISQIARLLEVSNITIRYHLAKVGLI